MFAQGDFLIGQNESPESIKAKRERIAEMLSRQPTPTTYGGGIAAMISGLVRGAQNSKIDQAEAKGMESGRRASENVFRMARGDAPISTAGDFPPPPQQESSFKPTERARQIITGLMQRGVPQPAAAGMVGNMQIESGLNSNINEKNPLVKGSRGGFGLNQWTADRRRALEAYAQQAGKPVGDLDLQLDYTMQELNGSERGARDKVFSAKTPEEAALAYSQHFLRPGIPHNDKRVAAARSFSSLLGDNTQVASLDQSIGLPQQQPAASQQMVQAQPAPTMYQDAGTPFERPATPQPSLDMGWMQQQRANQWLSPEARSYLDGEIARQEKMNDPAAQIKQQMDNIGLQKAQLELQKLQNPVVSQPTAKEDAYTARQNAAAQLGMKPDDPAYKSYVLTGKMPSEDQAPLTATDKTAILESDKMVEDNKYAINLLSELIAKNASGESLNDKVDSGAWGKWQPFLARYDPLDIFDDVQGKANTNFKNKIEINAVGALKTIFGSNPTDGERAAYEDLQASIDKTPEERDAVIQNAIHAAKARLVFNEQRAQQLRGGTYYKPQNTTPQGSNGGGGTNFKATYKGFE